MIHPGLDRWALVIHPGLDRWTLILTLLQSKEACLSCVTLKEANVH